MTICKALHVNVLNIFPFGGGGFAREKGNPGSKNPAGWAEEKLPVFRSPCSAATAHRRRAFARGLVRVEVQAAKGDAGLIRALAETLRGDPARAKTLRSALEQALIDPQVKTAFDLFGSDLPDEAFAGVFDQPRQKSWRELKL